MLRAPQASGENCVACLGEKTTKQGNKIAF